MNIIIGNDHGAVKIKNEIILYLESKGYKVENMGVDSDKSVDYPDIAKATCKKFLKGKYDFGILACGTGIGISIAANKVKGIRAALLHNSFGAQMAKEHNNANFIVFGGRIKYSEKIEDILENYICASFSGERHQKRIDKISALELK